MKCYRDKVAVISGAGNGIGRALAAQLAAAGARLALSDIDADGLRETIETLPAATEARGYRVDVSKRDEVFDSAEQIRRDFGTAHYVFNNAGVTMISTIAHATLEEIEWQLGVNLWGVIYGTKAFLPILLEQREGHIVNMSSVFGLAGIFAQGAYNVSKFGVRGWTECLWWELEGTGVKATCVHPGGIRTAIVQKARHGRNVGVEESSVLRLMDDLLITPPEHCARAILVGVAKGKKRILTGHKSRQLDVLTRLFPASYHRFIK